MGVYLKELWLLCIDFQSRQKPTCGGKAAVSFHSCRSYLDNLYELATICNPSTICVSQAIKARCLPPWWISLTSWPLIRLKTQAKPSSPPVTMRLHDDSIFVWRMQFVSIGWTNVWIFSMLGNWYSSKPSLRLDTSKSLPSWPGDAYPLPVTENRSKRERN